MIHASFIPSTIFTIVVPPTTNSIVICLNFTFPCFQAFSFFKSTRQFKLTNSNMYIRKMQSVGKINELSIIQGQRFNVDGLSLMSTLLQTRFVFIHCKQHCARFQFAYNIMHVLQGIIINNAISQIFGRRAGIGFGRLSSLSSHFKIKSS